jgi:hypothetical protein
VRVRIEASYPITVQIRTPLVKLRCYNLAANGYLGDFAAAFSPDGKHSRQLGGRSSRRIEHAERPIKLDLESTLGNTPVSVSSRIARYANVEHHHAKRQILGKNGALPSWRICRFDNRCGSRHHHHQAHVYARHFAHTRFPLCWLPLLVGISVAYRL